MGNYNGRMEFGHTGITAARNIKHHRERLGHTYTELARELVRHGRDIPTLGVRRMETGQRRIDIDDLIALAIIFRVSPITLLIPPHADLDTPVEVTGFGPIQAKFLWNWLNATYPLSGEVMAFYNDALPVWERDDMEQRLGAVRS